MANLSSFLGSIFSPYNKNKLKKFQAIVKEINEVEAQYEGKSQSELIQITNKMKTDYQDGVELDQMLVPAFIIIALTFPFFKFFSFQSKVIDLVFDCVKTSAILNSSSNRKKRTSSLEFLYKLAE